MYSQDVTVVFFKYSSGMKMTSCNDSSVNTPVVPRHSYDRQMLNTKDRLFLPRMSES